MARVLILGGDSAFNLGDTEIFTALYHSLAATDRRAQITITSSRLRQLGRDKPAIRTANGTVHQPVILVELVCQHLGGIHRGQTLFGAPV